MTRRALLACSPVVLAGMLAFAGCESGDKSAIARNVPRADAADSSAAAAANPGSSGTAGTVAAVSATKLVAAGNAAVPPIQAGMRQAPQYIRGIYLNAYAAGSKARLPKLIAMADNTEVNTFVIDFKDEKGPHYASSIPLAKQLTTPTEVTLRNPKAMLDTLHAHKIWVMARIVVFKDPILSKAKPDWSIRKAAGGLWQDKAGNTWVSAWEPEIWNYNISIAEEVAKLGVDEIQFDYVRFPEPFPSLPPQVHPKANGARSDAIAAFLTEAKRRLHPLGVPVAADVFGLTPADPLDVNIGQQWEAISPVADHILPMVYPSHFLPVHLPNVPHPNRMPYETVFKALGMAQIRDARLKDAGVGTARVIPWLQAFNAPWVDHNFTYGPEQATAQMRAVYDAGLNDWVFWHPGAKYEQIMAAFQKDNASRAKPFTAPAELVSVINMYDKQGAKAARDKAVAKQKASGAVPPAK